MVRIFSNIISVQSPLVATPVAERHRRIEAASALRIQQRVLGGRL
ncbi:MAG TPA: hypothetical protein VHM65_07870 [Candidatus Lustribacter sp.]|nr:hypothetical protein [Candidatus Lustribacter sp.]